MSTTRLRACETMWFKLGKNSRSSIENQLAQSNCSLNADENGKRTMMIRCILTELLECKVHEKAYVSICQYFFGTPSCNNSVRKSIRSPRFFDNFSSAFNALSVCIS